MGPIHPLSPGDQVRLIAPSSPFDPEHFRRGADALRTLGLAVSYDGSIFARAPEGPTAYLAGDDRRRAGELRAALGDPQVKAIVLARGGYGLLRLLAPADPQTPRLSPGDLLRPGSKAAPLLVGYSDATVLHELWSRAGAPSIHGPMATQLGEDPEALRRLGALLFGEDPGPLAWSPRPVDSILRRGPEVPVEGPLHGGNLALLASLCGTPLQPQYRGSLVLLEDLGEPPYRLDRLLTQLLLSGALEGAAGFVVGDLSGPGEDPRGRAEVVAERLVPLGVPVAFGAPFGHAGRNQPVALGCAHRLDAAQGLLIPLEAPTRARAEAPAEPLA